VSAGRCSDTRDGSFAPAGARSEQILPRVLDLARITGACVRILVWNPPEESGQQTN
jgi:hypothetical protein